MKGRIRYIEYTYKFNMLVLTAFSLSTIALVIYVSFFSWPNVEDLEHSIVSRETNLIQYVLNRAITHDGRYSTNFFHSINPLAYNQVPSYKYMVLSTIILFCTATFMVVNDLMAKAKLGYKVAVSVFFVAFIFVSSPSLYFSIY